MTTLIKVRETYEINLDRTIDLDWYLNSYTNNDHTNYYGGIQSTENNDFQCISSLSPDKNQRFFKITPKNQGKYMITFKYVSYSEAFTICDNKF
jgi:hypothetical protein